MNYIGRFAPSPTGPLHFGSLVAAVGSWLDARANNGKWLVRIENLDPPREVAGSIERILHTLQQHGLEWDGDLLYQSDRLSAYEDTLAHLKQLGYIYECACTRKDVRSHGGLHQRCLGNAQNLSGSSDYSLRLKVDNNTATYEDVFHGQQSVDQDQANEDFILKRKDGLHAYMLAVVVDDIYQEVTHIIRGTDLAHSSCQQSYLFQQLGYTSPVFGHLPMATHADGSKLSKQTHAEPIADEFPIANIYSALRFLNQTLPGSSREFSTVNNILDWGISHWTPDAFKGITDKVS